MKAPGFGDRRRDMLGDIAALTGGEVISSDLGRELEDATLEDLGIAEKVIVAKGDTTIVNGAGSEEDVQARIESIKQQIESTASDYEREKMQERLAKLVGGVAILSIGAATETEMKEKKDRVDDALHATRAAVAEGIVPGGGVALLRASKSLQNLHSDVEDINIGVAIVRRACEEPIRQICANAGIDGSVIVRDVLNADSDTYGFNARTEEYQDMVVAGVIDPKKVTRVALQNAASIASMILMTECAIVTIPEKNNQSEMPYGM